MKVTDKQLIELGFYPDKNPNVVLPDRILRDGKTFYHDKLPFIVLCNTAEPYGMGDPVYRLRAFLIHKGGLVPICAVDSLERIEGMYAMFTGRNIFVDYNSESIMNELFNGSILMDYTQIQRVVDGRLNNQNPDEQQ